MMMYTHKHEHTQSQLRANGSKLLGAASDVSCFASAQHLSLLCRLMWSLRMLRSRWSFASLRMTRPSRFSRACQSLKGRRNRVVYLLT